MSNNLIADIKQAERIEAELIEVVKKLPYREQKELLEKLKKGEQ